MEQSPYYPLPVPFDPVQAVEQKVSSGQTVGDGDVQEEGGWKNHYLAKGVSCRHFRFDNIRSMLD